MRAVRRRCEEFEAFTATRVSESVGRRATGLTGNFAAALFTHDTSRALDPHLHTHCIVFNATFDAVENRWKALQNHELLRARKFAENAYYHELARELRGFGYRIRNRVRGDFEIEGVSEQLCANGSPNGMHEIDEALAKAARGETGTCWCKHSKPCALNSRRQNEARKQKDLSRENCGRCGKRS
jgi:conjugative relaxase-like TrwC/TraI family protein